MYTSSSYSTYTGDSSKHNRIRKLSKMLPNGKGKHIVIIWRYCYCAQRKFKRICKSLELTIELSKMTKCKANILKINIISTFISVYQKYKKDVNDPDSHDGVITHLEWHLGESEVRLDILELDILELEVRWALGSITVNKTSGSDGIPAELFQALKDDAVKVLHSICQQMCKTQQWPQDKKRSVFIPIPKKVQTTAQLHSSHMLAKWCSKFSKLDFNSRWTENFLMLKLDIKKAEEPEINCQHPFDNFLEKESSRKTSTFALLTMPKPLTLWITTNCGKF